MRRYGVRSLTIWALLCFAVPLLLLPICRARGEGATWVSAGLDDHEIISLTVADTAVDSSPGWLYASTRGAGIWRMRIGENTWTSASWGLPSERWKGTSITEMIFLPATPAIAFGMDEQGGIYRSFDEGQSWERVESPSSSTRKGLLAVSRTGALYLTVSSLMYRSEDAGQTWSDAELLPDGMEAVCLAADLPARGALMMGASTGQILQTFDGGATWLAAQDTRTSTRIRAFAGTENGPLYAATASGLLQSLDGGTSWHLASPTLQGQDIQSLYMDRTNEQVLYVGLARGGVYYSLDGGEDWSHLGSGLVHRSITSLTLDTAGQVLFAASDDGVWAYDAPVLPVTSPTSTETSSPTPAPTHSATATPAPTRTATRALATWTVTPRATATRTLRPTRTASPTRSKTLTTTRTPTGTATMTLTPTQTPTPLATASATDTPVSATATPVPQEDTPEPPATKSPPEDPSPTPPR